MRLPAGDGEDGNEMFEGNQFTMPRMCERNNYVDEGGGKWRPFWQRGHTTLGDINELRPKRGRSGQNGVRNHSGQMHIRKTKLHHSTADLSGSCHRRNRKSKMTKSVSVIGLHRMPTIETIKRDAQKPPMSRHNSNLNLPMIEPDVEVHVDTISRNSSANYGTYSGGNGSSRRRSAIVRDDDDSEKSDSDEEVYLSDDDPMVSRQNLNKAGEYIVEHDWILKENLAKEARRVASKHKKIQIVLPDDDPLDTIKSRVDEITMMVKPKAEYGNFIDTIDPEQRERIMKYKNMDHKEIRNRRRKNLTPIQRFRDAVSTVLLLYRACHPRQRYLSEDKPNTAPDGVKKIKQKSPLDKDNLRKSSLGFEMQLALTSQPCFRSSEDIKRITWILRATKAFKNLFPAQLEKQLASVVSYERYDSKRIIAQQGRDPERFYYILTGKFTKVREYRLLSGVVTREEGVIEKGNTTEPQEMSQNWPREHHLVSKGNVEVLILEKSDFLDLLHTSKGPPIEFLQSLDLFKEFPCEEFRQSPDAIDFRYYGQEKIIVQDTNRTPWLHVVKTGRVKVVREQTVVDVQNEDKFSGQSKEELGCVKPFSHASAMLGLLANQRKMKTIVGAISFPEVTEQPFLQRSETEIPVLDRLKPRVSDTIFDNPITKIRRPSLIRAMKSLDGKPSEDTPKSPKHSRKRSKNTKTNDALDNGQSSQVRLSNISEDNESAPDSQVSQAVPMLTVTSPTLKSPVPSRADTVHKTTFLPPIVDKKQDNGFVPHGTYLTREKTEFDQALEKKPKKEVVHRKTHLQLDVLKPGDIFGLEHTEPQALASEGPGVCLISDGAEIIKISKRFFLTHAKNNTMLKVETMQREYMSPEEAKVVMYDKETWKQYKAVLLQRTVENLNRNSTEKVP